MKHYIIQRKIHENINCLDEPPKHGMRFVPTVAPQWLWLNVVQLEAKPLPWLCASMTKWRWTQ